MKAKDRRLQELKADIEEVTPEQAKALQDQGAALLDVRETDEVAQGSPANAIRLGRGFLELRVEDMVPDLDTPVLVMCAGGTRSLFAADTLQRMGYKNVKSVAGGFSRWKNKGLDFETPRMLNEEERKRYARHLTLPEVGEAGQVKLMESKVLLIGAGGLGSPSALYLAAAGVGTLGIVDHDVVDKSNLQRQILHTEARVDVPKVESAREAIESLNSSVKVKSYQTHINSSNIEDIIGEYDVVVDGSDNLPTRYLLNDACVKHNIPNVHAAVYRFEGQITVFWPGYKKRPGPCYRCLFPERPDPSLAPSCSEVGILGVLPGLFGLLQAVETLKVLLDLGDPLVGRTLYYDALNQQFTEFKQKPNPNCRYCSGKEPFPGYEDYAEVCAAPS